jgi:hypothetical protein
MATTIQITGRLQQELKGRKLSDSESYEDVLWDLLEDVMEITQETRRIIRRSEADVKAGRIHSLGSVKRELDV